MCRLFALLSLAALPLLTPPAQAEALIWSQTAATVAVNEAWAIYGEYQPRWFDRFDQSQSFILRTMIIHKLDDQWSVALGYAHAPQVLPTIRNENRIYQQVEFKPTHTSAFHHAFRSRMEERFIENTDGFSLRLRLRAQTSWMPCDFGAYAWNELFLNLNEKPEKILSGFDQNRLSIGFRYRHQPELTVELGYLLQTLRSANTTIASNSGVLLNVGVTIW